MLRPPSKETADRPVGRLSGRRPKPLTKPAVRKSIQEKAETMPALLDQFLVGPKWSDDWHMTASERSVLIRVLEQSRPDVSIEIGTFRCGSLRPIAHYSRRVITFDIDANQHRVATAFPSVDFVTGDSSLTLPPVIEALNASEHEELDFILIDGSHEADGVRADIAACLAYRPKRSPTVILMHDSSNPDVREGISSAPWDTCPYVHELDLDLCPGALYERADISGEIWGGLAGALLLPEPRAGALARQAFFAASRQAMLVQSSYPEARRR